MVRVRTDERGFTLPELMVAMVLTLIVTGGALTALQDANRASEIGAVLTDVNQNLRVGMNWVIKDLMQAGEGVRLGVPIPSGPGSMPGGLSRPGPVGSDWHFDENWATLPAASPGPEIGTVINSVRTDALTVLYEDHRLELTGVYPVMAADGSSATFPATFILADTPDGIKEGDLLMFTVGGLKAMQEVTGVAGQVVTFDDSSDSGLNMRGAVAGTILQLRDDEGNWPAQIEVRRVTMISYYLYVPSSGPITSPHLIRRTNWGPERVVALGIENLQLSWDLVDDQAEATTNQAVIPAGYSPNQIRKANLYMEARSMSEYSRTRQYLRTKLSTQVSLRSMAFWSLFNVE